MYAYEEGYDAYWSGDSSTANPYKDEKGERWHTGWWDAYEEEEAKNLESEGEDANKSQ